MLSTGDITVGRSRHGSTHMELIGYREAGRRRMIALMNVTLSTEITALQDKDTFYGGI